MARAPLPYPLQLSAVVFAAGAFCWYVMRSLLRGNVGLRGWTKDLSYNRGDAPVKYWLLIAFYGFFAVGSCVLVIALWTHPY
jgi:hypothetical protein